MSRSSLPTLLPLLSLACAAAACAHSSGHDTRPDTREALLREGEALYARGAWLDAALAFEEVAQSGSGAAGTADAFAKAGARNAILAWRGVRDEGERRKGDEQVRAVELTKLGDVELLPFDWPDPLLAELKEGEAIRETPLSDPEKRIAAACDRYFRIGDAFDSALPKIGLISAEIYFAHHQLVEGASRCERVIDRFSDTKEAGACSGAVLAAFNATGRWGELEQYARAFRKNGRLIGSDREFAVVLDRLIEGASFKAILASAEVSAIARDRTSTDRVLLAAARRFRAFQDEFPASPHAGRALYNAAIYFSRAGAIEDAISAARLGLDAYETSDMAEQMRHALKELEKLRPRGATPIVTGKR